MKVSELIENEFENVPINTETHMKELRRKRASLMHRKSVIELAMMKLFPEFSEDDFQRVFSYWRIKESPVGDFPERSQKYIEALKRINAQSDFLQKQEVSAKINMKYARHDPELALLHAEKIRKGRYPEGEDAIASHPQYAFGYATKVLRNRFPKGEPAIATDPDLKRQYQQMFGVKL